jgi:phospholipase D1/2
MPAHQAARESSVHPSLFDAGRNCFRVSHAERVAFLVDAESYFKAFSHAALRALSSILIVGWDFHSRTRLHHGIPDVPEQLGEYLNYLVRRRRGLEIRVLIWDYPMIFSKGRELSPIYGFGWRPHRRVKVRYDDHYPIGASQHQKIVVIDGELAFCGGLDLTRGRWDTREHKPGDERRINLGEQQGYPPFHDTMMAVDADAAGAFDDIARQRWWRATGRHIPADGVRPRPWRRKRRDVTFDPWPREVMDVAVEDVDVAVARTVAPVGDEHPIREVEALHMDLIKAARHSIYIENQYFTSNALGEALAERLREPHGPEVVAVLRLSTQGWLEAPTMGTLRTLLLKKLREADLHNRFHAYYPHIPGLPEGQCCDLHSKLMIVDDEALLIGSANFCNRSMGLDTECSAAIQAAGHAKVKAAIRNYRNQLLAEHLDVSPETVDTAHLESGSIHGTVDRLTREGRTLKPFVKLDEPSEAMIAIASNIADPEKPVGLDVLIQQFGPDPSSAPTRWGKVLAVAGVLLAFAALWRYTPLSGLANADHVMLWAERFTHNRWAPLAVMAAYTPACIVLFPRPIITLFAVVAFGAAAGFVYAFVGIMMASLLTYGVGRGMGRSTVRRIAGRRLNRLSSVMRERGVLAMTAVRLVPLAPFSVVNVVAGAIHVKPWHFALGTAIGILPGTLVATVFGDQLAAGLKDPRSINIWLIITAALVLGAATWFVRRWLFGFRVREQRSAQRRVL